MASLLNILLPAIPTLINTGIDILQKITGNDDRDVTVPALHGLSNPFFVGMPNPFSFNGNDSIDPSFIEEFFKKYPMPIMYAGMGSLDGYDASSAQITSGAVNGGHLGALIREAIAKKSLRASLLMESFVNIKGDEVNLILPLQFKYVNREINGAEDENGIPLIGIGDNAYCHLVPNLFKQWQLIKKYDFFYVEHVSIETKVTSNDTTSTQVAFFPFSKYINDLTDDELATAFNLSGTTKDGVLSYMINNFSPCLFEYKNEEGKPLYFIPNDYEVRPNLPFRTGVLDLFDEERKNGSKFLSFGTVCFIKENTSSNDVTVKVNVRMRLTCFNQSAVSSNNDDNGSSAQQAKPRKQVRVSNIITKKSSK